MTENPAIEFVQLQFNYVDYEDERVQSRLCYEVCVKHGKPVFVMEPVKGGQLVNMSAPMGKVIDDLAGGSRASYALRFAASFSNVVMVLSGMGNMDMMNDNISFMKDFSSERKGNVSTCKSGIYLSWGRSDSLYRLPLLRRRLSPANPDSGFVCCGE